MPVNWFDVFVVLMLFAGYVRGRKNGMSQELLPLFKWIFLIGVCSIAYEPLGLWLAPLLGVGKLFAFIFAYCLIAMLITFVFVGIGRSLGEKLKGSDAFGKGEFYLAMPAGVVRFACITLALLALLNARYYTTAEVKALEKFQNENYGSNFFPTLSSVQDDVFMRSFLGKQIKAHLSFLLIKPTAPIKPSTPVPLKRKAVSF